MAIVSLDGRPVPPELPRAQLSAIAHRGEWEPSLWEAPGVALGHVNLPRTPEAEREFLPMSDPSGRYWLTWDGRLDNRDELGPQLGYDVAERAQKTDAAYVLDAFIKWGDDCVHHLLGDWAVVIWDSEARRLFCAKDPLGWRQLYHAEHDGLLAVGSEPQQFFADGWLPKSPDVLSVISALKGESRRYQSTYYQCVQRLESGFALGARARSRSVSQFYQLPRVRDDLKDDHDLDLEFNSRFSAAVKARLRSNGKVAISLSGGIDSSCVAVAASGFATERNTAIVAYDPTSGSMDERQHAHFVADRTGLQARDIDVSRCWTLSRDWLPDAAWDTPEVPPQGATVVAIARAASASGATTLLGGESADIWWSGSSLAGIYEMWEGGVLGPRGLRRLVEPRVARSCSRIVASNVQEMLKHMLPPPKQAEGGALEPLSFRRRSKRLFEQYGRFSAESVGWRDRHAWSRNSIDFRAPFADQRVVELALSVPDFRRRRGNLAKVPLRRYLHEAGLRSIADRRDYGLYDDLVERGLAHAERQRVQAAVKALTTFPYPGVELTKAILAPSLKGYSAWSPDAARLIGLGLWLACLSIGRDDRQIVGV